MWHVAKKNEKEHEGRLTAAGIIAVGNPASDSSVPFSKKQIAVIKNVSTRSVGRCSEACAQVVMSSDLDELPSVSIPIDVFVSSTGFDEAKQVITHKMGNGVSTALAVPVMVSKTCASFV